MRTIRLKVLTQNSLVSVITDVRTFGEFKNLTEVQNLEIDWSQTKLIDRASKGTFSDLDEAVLPSIDCLMFLMPTKSKAGVDLSYSEVKNLVKNYKAAGGYVPFNYTQSSANTLNNFWNSLEPVPVEENSSSNTIFLTTGTYTVIVEEKVHEKVELVDETTLDDLQVEIEVLTKKIK